MPLRKPDRDRVAFSAICSVLLAMVGCAETRVTTRPPSMVDLSAIERNLITGPEVYLDTWSPANMVASRWKVEHLALSSKGVQVGQQRLHVPWNEVTAIATIDRARGGRKGLLYGLAIGALAGAFIGAGCEGAYIFGCTRNESMAIGSVIFGLGGMLTGLVGGRTTGYASTWSVQGPRIGD